MLMTAYTELLRNSTPLLEAYLQRRQARGKEDPARGNERRGKPSQARGPAPLVWLHGASVGESLALLALVNRLLADDPAINVMVTTGTVTSAKLMAERLPPRAFHQYMPVDHPDWVESFLGHWKPDFIIWSESDLWPNMLAGIRRRNIPAVLLNARMSQKSFYSWQLARGLIKSLLGTFQLCLAQNDAEAARLQKLGAVLVKISGNLKYAARPLPCDDAKLAALKEAAGARPLLLWASTHPGEEEVALRLHAALQKNHPSLLTIIVPRHPQRGTAIADMAVKAGLTPALRGQNQLPRAQDTIYIADTLGELGLFYRLAPTCIIGGSFANIGGHNPIEPAQLGCQIFYGPHMFNFVSIAHDFESRGAAQRVVNEAALAPLMEQALADPQHFAAMATAAKEWTASQAHIVDDIAATLAPFMQNLKLPAQEAAA